MSLAMGNAPGVVVTQGDPFSTRNHKVVRIDFSWGLRLNVERPSILRGAAVSCELCGDEKQVWKYEGTINSPEVPLKRQSLHPGVLQRPGVHEARRFGHLSSASWCDALQMVCRS